jgi:drug/metabolite transporter (DMT)-like permease
MTLIHKDGSLINKKIGRQVTGIQAALVSALFLGLAPVFGKQAIISGFSPLAVVALRTSMAAGILLILVALFKRPYLYIYPAGLIGCSLAGAINGLGSIFFYLALERLSVSVGQLLYSLYPVFLVIWLIIDRQPPSWMTYVRIFLAILGILFLTSFNSNQVDWVGVGLMLAASTLYAIHLPINQRVLFDIPAPTVTLYTLLAMSAIVIPAYLIFDRHLPPAGVSWSPLFLLTGVTFFSRLTLFMGIKRLGGLQTALLGLSELLVSISVSYIWLDEKLHWVQWVGALLLGISLLLISFEKIRPEQKKKHSLLGWLRPPDSPSEINWGPHD